MRVSHDVFLDESLSWYSLLSLTPEDSKLIVGGEANETNSLKEGDIGTQEGSLISFWLSGLNERLSRNDQLNDESAISGDSAMQSLHQK